MQLWARSMTLHLATTFRISRLAVDSMDTCVVTLEDQDLVAFGEGSPVGYTGESADDLVEAIEAEGEALLAGWSDEPERALDRILRWDGPAGAKMALDGAVHDWMGKRVSQPTWRLLGGSRVVARTTGFTLGIAPVEETVAQARLAPDVGVLKVKVGGPDDLDRLEAVRQVTAVPFRVDANEGWTFDTARELTPWLRELGAVLLEQPFPAAATTDYQRYHDLPGHLPLFIDEGCTDVDSVVRASRHADGVVLKLSKSGGIAATRQVIGAARGLGMEVMLSCMVESELAISQAAQLAPLVDHVDLDSHLMIRDSPFTGLDLDGGRIVLPDAPGLGVTPAT